MELGTPQFWLAGLEIIVINILLSGDNAVVIALACRSLPPHQRRWGVFWGAIGAIVLRIVLTFFAVALLELPYLKLVGGALLVWIGVKLIAEDEGDGHEQVAGSDRMLAAIKTVIVADLVMSIDNVIAVAAAAGGSYTLLILGLAISIPLVIVGAQLIMKLIERMPILILAGGGLLGYVAGEMVVEDPALAKWITTGPHWLHWGIPLAGVVLVIAVAKWIDRGREAREA
jgi:YjbE family integral membrane protein